jgi:hypothetical protein
MIENYKYLKKVCKNINFEEHQCKNVAVKI